MSSVLVYIHMYQYIVYTYVCHPEFIMHVYSVLCMHAYMCVCAYVGVDVCACIRACRCHDHSFVFCKLLYVSLYIYCIVFLLEKILYKGLGQL